MIRRLVPRGLRGRLLAAFVITSALTLLVAAAVLLGPLQDKLRSQSVEKLRDAVVNARGSFDRAGAPDQAAGARESTDVRCRRWRSGGAGSATRRSTCASGSTRA